jgi:hypothetical protein
VGIVGARNAKFKMQNSKDGTDTAMQNPNGFAF